MPNLPKYHEVAEQLVSYVTYRAKHENVSMELTVDWFEKALRRGFGEFFGITVDLEKGMLLTDTQFPRLLVEWRATQTKH